MANAFYQIYYQLVFAVKYRQALIPKEHKEDVHRYISGLVQHRGAKMFAIHCMPDHTHLFISGKPTIVISDLIKEIKVESNQFINAQPWSDKQFAWQVGYGAFTYSHSQVDQVVKYIKNQEAHHAKRTFKEEYIELLHKFEIPYEEQYLFDFGG